MRRTDQMCGQAFAGDPAGFSDGSAIYFTSGGSLWSVESAGGTPDRMVEGAAGGYAVHPDGQTILFLRGGVWIAKRGETPREFAVPEDVAASGGRRLIGFSPDGSMVACIVAGRHLWLLPYPSGTARRLVVRDVQDGSWMPDGRHLVLTRTAPNSSMFSMLDVASGDDRVFYVSPEAIVSAAVSRDGQRLAFVTGRLQWSAAEVGIADGRVRFLQPSGEISGFPDWDPDGTRYLHATFRAGRWGVDESSATDRFTRRVAEVEHGGVSEPRWAPDGSQFTFTWRQPRADRVMLSNPSGQMSPLDPSAPGPTLNAIWSGDGRFVIYSRMILGKGFEVARVRPGSAAKPEILASYAMEDARWRFPVASSRVTGQILARSGGRSPALFLMAADYGSERPLTRDVWTLSASRAMAGTSSASRAIRSQLAPGNCCRSRPPPAGRSCSRLSTSRPRPTGSAASVCIRMGSGS